MPNGTCCRCRASTGRCPAVPRCSLLGTYPHGRAGRPPCLQVHSGGGNIRAWRPGASWWQGWDEQSPTGSRGGAQLAHCKRGESWRTCARRIRVGGARLARLRTVGRGAGVRASPSPEGDLPLATWHNLGSVELRVSTVLLLVPCSPGASVGSCKCDGAVTLTMQECCGCIGMAGGTQEGVVKQGCHGGWPRLTRGNHPADVVGGGGEAGAEVAFGAIRTGVVGVPPNPG